MSSPVISLKKLFSFPFLFFPEGCVPACVCVGGGWGGGGWGGGGSGPLDTPPIIFFIDTPLDRSDSRSGFINRHLTYRVPIISHDK